MARASLIVCLSLFLALQVNCASIAWTGGGGNGLWNFANNWSPAAVPTAADDVTISANGGATVTISQPASAKSVMIGGSSFGQSLVILSRLSVGSGGIRASSGASVSVQNNNDLPLSSVGPVTFSSGSQFIFQSGSIRGPGDYFVASGATLTFSQAALKQIAATNLTAMGTITIQSSTIQLAEGGKFFNQGALSALGGITILLGSVNSTAASSYIESRGSFTYTGTSDAQPLLFLAPVMFYEKFTIASGRVVIGNTFETNSSVIFSADNAMLEVQAGPPKQVANFGNIVGSTMTIAGNARFTGSVSVTTIKLVDSGSAAFTGDALITNFMVSGKVTTSSRVRVTDFSLAGGNINSVGTGSFAVVNVMIQDSSSGNTNSFINVPVTVTGNATIVEDVVVLFGASAELYISSGAYFNVKSAANFVQQVGTPSIRVDGTMIVDAVESYLQSSVRISGNGVLRVDSGKMDFTTTMVTIKTVDIASKGFVNFIDSNVNISAITGAGGVNISTLPGKNVIGNVVASYIGFNNGPVNVTSFITEAIIIGTADVYLTEKSVNKAFEMYFRGGSIVGKNATIDTNILEVGGGLTNEVLDGVHITAKTFKLKTGNSGALLTKNGASITVL